MDDPFGLQRFVDAQAGAMPAVEEELRQARKRTHWMWFVFPQHVALGRSATARRFGLRSLDEARAYLAHPELGPRLRHCCELLLAAPEGRSAHDILGSPDDLKLRSCLTLFQRADPAEPVFSRALRRFYAGEPDPLTLDVLDG
jgi:uncharacterized protein (DUF1810 family)